MSQGVVTNYFAKKRRGGYIQPSKRLKLDGEARSEKLQNGPEKAMCEIRATRRTTRSCTQTSRHHRSTRTSKASDSNERLTPSLDKYFKQFDSIEEPEEGVSLKLSPATSDSGSSVNSEVVTAANDDHDSPQTPKRRRQKGLKGNDELVREKRGRATPKKLGFDFQVSEDVGTTELQPITSFPAVKRQRQKGARRKLLPTSSAKESENGSVPDRDVASGKTDEMSSKTDENKKAKPVLSKRSTRSRRNATSEVPQQASDTNVQKTKDLAEKLLAKKKESPEALKEALKSSGNLKDLQETLMKIRNQKKKQKEEEKAKKTQKKKTVQESKKEVVTAQKREFAYEMLHSLAQDVPKGLTLPYKYKILAELFRCADTAVSMLFNRQQVTTWSTLQKSVKDMSRKNFELDHLGQIKSVFPLAYQYRQEKGLISYADHIRPSDYQLTIEPVLDETGNDNFGEGSRKLTSGMLVKRKHHFVVQLVNIVKEHHKKFLSALDPPIQIQDDKILRWHPQFPLDRCPDVDKAELPKPPNHDKGRCNSAKEVLDKARSKFTKKAVDALKKVAEKASSTPEKQPKQSVEENNNITPNKAPTPVAKPASALKGVSQSLLMKIRAKEAEKKIKSMVRSEDSAKRLEMVTKLPDVARALRMLYVTEKKAALPLEYICDKLVKCCSGILTPVVVQEHVLLLAEHLPTWLNQIKVRNISYIKMNKEKEMADIIQHLQRKIKEAEKA